MKKRFTFFLLGVLFLIIPWQYTNAQNSVYLEEGFEGVTGVPTGWDVSEGTWNSSPWGLYSGTYGVIPYSGSNCMVFDSYYNASNTYSALKTASVTIPSSASDVNLSFWCMNYQGGDFSVYVSTDGGATYTNNLLESNIVGVTEWTRKVYSLNAFIGQTINVVFKATSNWGASPSYYCSMYIDDVKIYDVPSCARPINVMAYSATQTDISLIWDLDNEGDSTSTFIVNVKDDNGNVVSNDTAVMTTSFMGHTISGLSPNTHYNVTVKSDCSANSRGYSAISEVVGFTTLCSHSQLPYTNNFDNETTIPSCWVVNSPTTSTTVNSTIKNGSSGKSFCLQATENSSCIVSTGQFNHAANDIQIDFNVTAYADKTPFVIGLISDPYDISTFEPLFNLQVKTGMEWKNVRVNTHLSSRGNATGASVAIQLPSGNNNVLYIDDLSITSIPSCVRPEDVVATALDSVSISVQWDAAGNTATNFQVELTNLTDTSVVVNNFTSNPLTIGNLSANNSYQVRVRAICSATDTSEWSLPVEVTTLCGAYQVPFYEDFEGLSSLPTCWSTYCSYEGSAGYGNVSDGWQLYQSTYAGNSNVHQGSGCLTSPDSKAGTRYVLKLPPINIPQTGDYELNFWMRREESETNRENITIYINNVPSLEGATKIDSIERNLRAYPSENGGSAYYEYFYPITMRGIVYIIIESQHQYVGPIYLDDISVEPKRACRNAVNNINYVADVDNNTVRLSWKTRSEETSWLVKASVYNQTTLVCEESVAVNDTAYTFDFSQYFTSATTYDIDFSVRALCANGDTAAATTKSISLSTPCDVFTLPLTEGFEDTTFPPLCWTALTDPNSATPGNTWYRNSYYVANGTGSACFNDASDPTIGFLSTPIFNLESGTHYSFSINIRRTNSYTSKLYEGVSIWLSPVQGDTTNATKLGFIPRVYNLTPVAASTGFSNYSWTISPETTGNYCFIIQARQQNGEPNYVDDVQIRQLSSCLPLGTDQLTISPLFNTANVKVNNINKEIEYVVCSAEDVVEDSINASDVLTRKMISATDSTFEITGLNTNTTYNLYVRIICNDTTNEISDWTGPFSFVTLCEAPVIADDVQFFDSFEDMESSSVITSSNTCYNINADNYVYVKGSIGDYLTSSGTTCVPFDGNQQLAVYYGVSGKISRPMYLYAGRNYESMIYSRMNATLLYDQSEMALFYAPMGVDTAIYSVKNLPANSGEWTKFAGYFTVPVDGYYNVGFEFTQKSTYGSYMAFDYFRVREVACIPPTNVEVLGISSNSVTVQLTSNSTQWEVRVCTEKPADTDNDPVYVIADTITSNQFVINGLSQNTDYFLIVRSNCSGTYSDWSRPVQFTTDCLPFSVPYSTSFETDIDVRCWRQGGSQGILERSVAKKKFGAASALVKQADLISPQLIVDSLTGYMISGWVYTAQPTTIGVGVQTDPNDVSTYAFVDSIVVPNNNVWMEFTVYLDEFTSANEEYEDLMDAKYIVLSCNGEFNYYFDELIISTPPTCLKPTSVAADVIDAYSAQVDFQTSGTESQWLITAFKVLNNSSVAVKDTLVTATSVVVGGLEPISSYYFTARAICSAKDTSFMSYSNTINTPCAPMILPHSANLANGVPQCWNLTATPNSSLTWYYYSYYGYIHSNTSYSSSFADTAYVVSPEFNLRSNNGVIVKIDGYQDNVTDSINTYLRYTLDGGATYTRVDESCLFKGTRGVKELTISNVGPGVIQFEIVAQNHISSVYRYLYGVEIEEIDNCVRPQTVSFVTTIDTTFVTITDTASDHTQWDYCYDVVDFNPNTVSYTSVNDKYIKLTGLQAHTEYVMYVRSNCGSEVSSWVKYTFLTPCDVVTLPYFEGFENLNVKSDILNDCYTFYSENPSNRNCLGSDYPGFSLVTDSYSKYKSTASSRGIMWMSSSTYYMYLYLPQFELPVNSTVLTFKYVNESTYASNSNFVVGLMLPDNENSFTAVYTCPIEATSMENNEVTVDFTQLPAGDYSNYRIAFRYGINGQNMWAAIDDISVVSKVKCYEAPVVEFNNLDNNSVWFNVDYYADSLKVAYGTTGTDVENCTAFYTNDHDITISELTEGTTYDVYVTTVCAGIESAWVGPMTVTTECNPIAISMENPWVENFDNTDISVRFPDCMAQLITSESSGIVYPIVVDTTVITSPSALAMKGNNMVALPRFTDALTSYTLSLYARGSGNIIVGAVNGVDASSFSTITTINLVSGINRYDVDLSMYQFSGNRIALQTTGASVSLFIDSLTISNRPTCFAPRFVSTIVVADVTAEVACTLSPITESYQYYILSGSDTLQNVTVNGTTNRVNIENLTASTAYEFGIRTTCSDGVTSDWTTITFTTINSLVRAPFSFDFESTQDNALFNFKNDAYNFFVIGSDANGVYEGSNALYISNNSSTKAYEYFNDQTQKTYVTLPVYLSAGSYTVSYKWKSEGEVNYDYARVFLAPYNTVINAGSAISDLGYSYSPDNFIMLDGNTQLAGSGNWNTQISDFVIEEPITAQFVVSWFNDGSWGNNPPIAIDNLVFSKFDCVDKIDSVVISALSVNSFKLNVYNNAALHDSIHYFITDAETGTVIISDTVSVASNVVIDITGLSENTAYIYEVGGFCDAGNSAYITGKLTTKCSPIIINQSSSYSEDFETFSYSIPFEDADPCWDVVNNSSTYNYGDLGVISPNNTNVSAYEGQKAITIQENRNVTIIRQANIESGDYQFMLFANSNTPNGKVSLLIRQLGATTWDTLTTQVVNNSYEPIVAKVTLIGDTHELGININTKSCVYGDVMIDNISFGSVSVYVPSNLNVTNITSNTADVSWSAISDTHRLQLVSGTATMLDTVLTSGVSNLTLAGLNPNTDYTVKVNAIAADGVTASIVISKDFSTLCTPFVSYRNDFEQEVAQTRPDCWSFEAYKYSGDAFDLNDDPTNTYPHWTIFEKDGNKVLAIYPYMVSSNAQSYIYSPTIAVGDGMKLSFKYLNQRVNADSLVVYIISNDVQSAPILTVYNLANAGSWTDFSYDLSEYVGSNIRVKFRHRSSYNGWNEYIAIDDFKVSCEIPGDTIDAVTCANESYVGNGFNISASQLFVGQTTTFTRTQLGLNGACDTLVTLNVYVQPAQTIFISDTICEGDVYNNGRFANLTTTGRYQQVYQSYAGCDSIVYLNLTVIPAYYSETVNLCEGDTYNFAGQTITSAGVYTDTIARANGCDSIVTLTVNYSAKYYEESAYFCEGTSYYWNGVPYNTPGRHENRLTNSYGCDSILVLNLEMIPTNVYQSIELCEGQTYDFFGTTITEAGTYTHTLANSLGCDSIINITITKVEAPINRVSDYVCEGKEYYGYGFTLNDIVSDTVVTRTVKTLDGCDSIVELTLDFIPTVRVAITATINEGETYEFGGNSLTQAGEYENTFHTALGCDSVVTLTLNVTTPVDNAYALPIVVAPNPVYGGQSTFVNREWTVEEQTGMRVEVLNSVGQVVDVFTPTTLPIEVGGIYTSGVYYIRVTTGTGDIYLGRLVVR